MIKVLLLIFDPVATWERIDQAGRKLAFVLFLYLLPLLVITLAGEGYGIFQWGKEQGVLQQRTHVQQEVLITYEVMQLLLSLLVVFIGALLIKAIAVSFHGRPTYIQVFTAVAYSLGPLFLLRLLDAIPVMNVWVTWIIGACLSFAVFYSGLPRILKPDPAHALGLYFLGVLVLLVTSGLGRFVATLLLEQRMKLPF